MADARSLRERRRGGIVTVGDDAGPSRRWRRFVRSALGRPDAVRYIAEGPFYRLGSTEVVSNAESGNVWMKQRSLSAFSTRWPARRRSSDRSMG